MVIITLALALFGGRATSAQDKQDKYTVQVPGGLAFSEFRGYEDWQSISVSKTDRACVCRSAIRLAAALATPASSTSKVPMMPTRFLVTPAQDDAWLPPDGDI